MVFMRKTYSFLISECNKKSTQRLSWGSWEVIKFFLKKKIPNLLERNWEGGDMSQQPVWYLTIINTREFFSTDMILKGV